VTTATKKQWKPFSRAKVCPLCEKPDRCLYTDDGAIRCFRTTGEVAGHRIVKTCSDHTVIYRPDDGNETTKRSRTVQPATNPLEWGKEAARLAAAITPQQLDALAARLQLPTFALTAIDCGWASRADLKRLKVFGKDWDQDYPDGAYSFPERDGHLRVIGIGFRAVDGRKGCPKGCDVA